MEVKKGDILIYHTGYHRYFNGAPEEDEERYFLRHPGGDREFAEWIVEMELAWTGLRLRLGRPSDEHVDPRQAARRARAATRRQIGRRRRASVFPEEDLFVMHRVPFRTGITHVENVGGDIEQALNRRCLIGAFPIPIEGGEASPCRLVAFLDE